MRFTRYKLLSLAAACALMASTAMAQDGFHLTARSFHRMVRRRFRYHLVTAHALWPFPVFCWLLLVSGWARRATLLWAALPVVALGGIEKLVFNTSYFIAMVGVRLIGGGAPTTSRRA